MIVGVKQFLTLRLATFLLALVAAFHLSSSTAVAVGCSTDPLTYCGDPSEAQCINNVCHPVCGGVVCQANERCDQTLNTCIAEVCDPGRGGVNLGSCLRLSDDSRVSDRYYYPATLVNLIVRNLFVAAGVILFLMIIIAGVKFISGGKKGVDEAKTIISTALAGFIIMFAAYWIVQLIQYITGADIVL